MIRKSVCENGVIIESGAQDWQIFQQDARGVAAIALAGRWLTAAKHTTAQVLVRLIHEDRYDEVSLEHSWTQAETRPDGTWSLTLRNVPRGGLYRIETGLQLDGSVVEWITRGDMIHHIGVGDIWVITGQSNAAGYGKTPAADGPELGLHMFHADGSWKLAAHPLSDSSGSQYVANREGANGSHSPWLAFARKLRRELGHPIGLVPASLGGSPLAAWTRGVDGRLFENMLAYTGDGCGNRVRGVVWYQGESDTGPEARVLYRERFTKLVNDWRKVFRDPRLPVITVQLNRYVGEPYTTPTHPGWEFIRELQRQIPREIPGVYVISALDLGLSDGIHNDSNGNLTIGDRCAAVALGAVHGRHVKYLHPDLERVRRSGARRLDLVFANINTRLHFEDRIPEHFPFAVRDEGGAVPVKSWAIIRGNTFRIELERALRGQATVTGAPTACPPTVIPFDICGYRPMLGFTADVPAR
ncbi:MAG: hypothetical protein BWZ02_00689 [Lentisphaerae bacterium ADurb.BinA184]|nr:MAG: hypothetical protein BWZ02_00689 [Lentisphaerae bacterium ADurb.BinA184]